ncbi:MAG: type II toxin-antitoxin system RelE/ParE family toxin [Gammaproteobacteria bacterium]|nr:type II toxin-antitoxin system RelE/ParE family toxin [Gammaproteobacteria bacterium]MDD9870568.1 type II toxin-antitoxin system RelE/ParE family toxin [Gammaproteobacteria bacterium]
MPYNININDRAMRELQGIQSAKIRRQISDHIDNLEDNPRPGGCQSLQGYAECYYRIRQGDYRIIYQIDDDTLTVSILMVGHRRNVYIRFRRRHHR